MVLALFTPFSVLAAQDGQLQEHAESEQAVKTHL